MALCNFLVKRRHQYIVKRSGKFVTLVMLYYSLSLIFKRNNRGESSHGAQFVINYIIHDARGYQPSNYVYATALYIVFLLGDPE